MTNGPTAGIDRFTRQLRDELVAALYPQHDAQGARAATAHHRPPARRRPSRRRLLVALAVAVVAVGLAVGPSLVRGGTGYTDALAVTALPDGRVRVDMPRDFTDPGPLAARLRPYGVNVAVQRCTPPLVWPGPGGTRIIAALRFGPIGPQESHATVQRLGAGRFTIILDPKHVRSDRRARQVGVGWLYVFVSQATPQAKPVLEPTILGFKTTTAASSRNSSPACPAGTPTTR